MADTASSGQRLVFPEKQQVDIETFDLPEIGGDDVRMCVRISLMSTGTEATVFNRLFDAGTHWDRWVKYPFFPGYAAVGVVEAVGAQVTTLKVGDRVACRGNHASHITKKAEDFFPIPDALPWEEAVWFSLAKIAFHGANAADYKLGDSALIIGAGPIGQMSIRWARAVGCTTIIAVDTIEDRLNLATAGGATACIAESIGAARDAVLAANGGALPRVVIDSTGNAAVFSAALGIAAQFGRVVVLGDTGQPTRQALTNDVIRRGLTIVGAHDNHNNAEHNNATISKRFFTLATTGRFPLAGLNTHTFLPQDCKTAYATANRQRSQTMGILFDWSSV